MQKIFLGPDGIRAGWRIALFVSFFALFGFMLETIVHVFDKNLLSYAADLSPGFLFLQELIQAASAIAAAAVMGLLEARSIGDFGLPLAAAFRGRFWQGALWGTAEVSALILAICAFGGFSFGTWALAGTGALAYAAKWALVFLMVGISEEFLFRGYVQFTLASSIGFWPAALSLSAAFGAVHLRNPGEGLVGALGVFAIGLFFCFTLRRTGNLWFAIGMHAAFDFGETYLYSVPDSGLVMPGHLLASSLHGARWLTGGTIGPEGSVFSFVIVALGFLVFDRLYPAEKK